MYDASSAVWQNKITDYETAALFLAGLNVDADLFTNPARGEEWLMAAENVHHALMAMEQHYAGSSPGPVPFWFSSSPLGVECREFLQLATKVPHLMERLSPTQKLAFFVNLIGMVTAACEDIARTAH